MGSYKFMTAWVSSLAAMTFAANLAETFSFSLLLIFDKVKVKMVLTHSVEVLLRLGKIM